MNTKSSSQPRNENAFTLIELLVVIAIIGILASLLLPALGIITRKAKEKAAKVDEVNLIGAISQYKATYSIQPASTNAIAAAASANKVNNDFTFGSIIEGVPSTPTTTLVAGLTQQIITPDTTGYQNANSEVIAILRDDLVYPEAGNGYSHIYNSQKTIFFNSKLAATTNSAGVDTNSVLRDPWGTPYMVTLDMNGDGKCYDQAWMAWQGKTFFVPGESMVWSLGYTKTCDYTQPLSATINQNLVPSWK